jgi:hypothetical protein
MPFWAEVNGGWEWLPATILGMFQAESIAVTPLEKQRDASKNRSHNQE